MHVNVSTEYYQKRGHDGLAELYLTVNLLSLFLYIIAYVLRNHIFIAILAILHAFVLYITYESYKKWTEQEGKHGQSKRP